MSLYDWKQIAKERLESGEMTVAEWANVLDRLCMSSEEELIDLFDDAIDTEWKRRFARKSP